MFFVRTAMDKDVDALRAVLIDTFHATYDALYGPDTVQKMLDAWHSRQAIKARIGRQDAEFLVADDGRRIGGVAYAAMSKDIPKTAILHHLYVDPTCQRQGIGRDMFSELETCFPDATAMRLNVDPRNPVAVRFYVAHGFLKVGETADCGGQGSGIAADIMEKPLAAA